MPPELVPAAPAAPTVRVPSAKPVDLLGGGAVLLTPSRDAGLFARTTSVGEERAEDVSLEVLDAASRPESPVSPNRTTIGLAGGVAGLMFGLMLARRRA